jgi:hypothetical protein
LRVVLVQGRIVQATIHRNTGTPQLDFILTF